MDTERSDGEHSTPGEKVSDANVMTAFGGNVSIHVNPMDDPPQLLYRDPKLQLCTSPTGDSITDDDVYCDDLRQPLGTALCVGVAVAVLDCVDVLETERDSVVVVVGVAATLRVDDAVGDADGVAPSERVADGVAVLDAEAEHSTGSNTLDVALIRA